MLNIGYAISEYLQEMGKFKFLFVVLTLISISCSPIRNTINEDSLHNQNINVPIWIPNTTIVIESKIQHTKNKKTLLKKHK